MRDADYRIGSGAYYPLVGRLIEAASLRVEWGPACVKLTYSHDRITVTLADSNEEYVTQDRHFTREDDARRLYYETAYEITRFGENLTRFGWKSEQG